MARKNMATTPKYDALRARSQEVNETNDCAVKALAVLCDVDYDLAREALRVAGRKDRRGVATHKIPAAARLLGFRFVTMPWNTIQRKVKLLETEKNYRVKKLTTRQVSMFPDLFEDWGNVAVYTNGHVVAIKDGEVHDWSIGRALRITETFVVRRVGEPLVREEK